MKVAYISKADPEDLHAWSGIIHSVKKSLVEQGNDMQCIFPLHYNSNKPLVRFKKLFYRNFSNNTYQLEREPIVARAMGRKIESSLHPDTQVLFSPSSIPVSMIRTDRPKVFYTDATFSCMLGFYDAFTNLCRESIQNGHDLERRAIHSSALAIYSSQWAADSAIRYYGADPARVHVVPFGSNLPITPDINAVKDIIESRSRDELHLLFLAVDWNRKGGDAALETAAILHRMGVKVTLHVAGIKTFPFREKPSYLTDHGYVSKRTEEGRKKLAALMSQCHFMLVPSRADCTPIVFGEANSFGMPVITTDVGGIPSVIREGVNGSLFSPEGGAERYALRILEYWIDRGRYEDLCHSSYGEYDTRLNWKSAGAAIQRLLERVV